MLIEIPERDPRVELLATALCASEHSLPGAWDHTAEHSRQSYRREARELLTELDAVPSTGGLMPVTSESIHILVGAAGDLTYRRDAVSLGPFASEPLDMWKWFSRSPEGFWRSGDEIRAASVGWLLGALHDAGVALGDYDRAVVGALAKDSSTTAQVVAGWIARARWPPAEPGTDLHARDPV